MSLTDYLNNEALKPHSSSRAEIASLLAVVERELTDANVTAISLDRRFACSYNAALQLGHIVLAAAGYRTSSHKSGHHKTTFECMEFILGSAIQSMTDHFEIARRKRNMIDYNVAGAISESEAEDLQKTVLLFRSAVERWLSEKHPALIGRE